uniref:BRISC and BRCA1-A complex member 1-like protein n=1 Tax=Callorhinchus milii TaxID=7868 RepID=V9KUC0_CALMI
MGLRIGWDGLSARLDGLIVFIYSGFECVDLDALSAGLNGYDHDIGPISRIVFGSFFPLLIRLKTNALNIAQKMIEMFVRTKHKIDKRHEFALVVVNDEVTWLSGFTSDPREVCSCLYDLDTSVCDSFNLDGLFNLIQQKIELPITENIQTIPPPYIVRMILIYIRASCHPQLASMERLNKILQSAYFFFDVIYIHNGTEEMEETSNNKEIYSFFNQLDTKGTSYKYDVSLTGQALELHNCMAKLLAHPLQRPFQMHAVYSLLEDEEAVEVEATV